MSALIVTLTTFMLVADSKGGKLMDGRFMMHRSELPHTDRSPQLLPGANNPVPVLSHDLGQYQMWGHDQPNVTSSSMSEWSPFYRCTHNGFLAKQGSCRDYYQCQRLSEPGLFSVFLHTCPPGAIFDDITDTCNLMSHVTSRPECTTKHSTVGVGGTNLSLGSENGNRTRLTGIVSSTDATINNSSPLRRRQKRAMPFSKEFLGYSLIHNQLYFLSIAPYRYLGCDIDLRSVKNKLIGMWGKLSSTNPSTFDRQIATKISSDVTQILTSKGLKNILGSLEIFWDLYKNGIFDDTIFRAIMLGLINQENGIKELTLPRVKVTIKEVQEYISQKIGKAKSSIQKGYESVPNSTDMSIIKPLISKLLSLIREFNQRLNYLEALPLKDQQNEIERSGGYLEYLEANTIGDTLYDITQGTFTISNNSSDTTSITVLDLVVHWLQIYTSMSYFVVSSNVYLAGKAFGERNLEEYNAYLWRVDASLSRIKLTVGYGGSNDLIEGIKRLLNDIEELPYASEINGLEDFLYEKRADLNQIESEIKKLIKGNTELFEQKKLIEELDFSISSILVPIGQWKSGIQVSYAIQYVSEIGVSKIGKWSKPYTVQDKANPTVYIPTTESGITRFVYRRFNQEKPELVAVLSDNEQISFRDIDRDTINAASNPNGNEAAREMRSLLEDGADVNATLENNMIPLHYAAKYGNVKVMDILMSQSADIHSKSIDHREPLHFAVMFEAEEAIDYLISKGANVNAQTGELRWSPLHIAVANGYARAAQALIINGASINLKSRAGITPLHLSFVGNEDTLKVLLRNEDLNINAVTDDGLTPLHYATASRDSAFVRNLLQHDNINVNPISGCVLSPIHLAALNDNMDIITKLIEYKSPLSAPDQFGSTPLQYAAFYGNQKAVLVLIQIDETLKAIMNSDNKTALDIATENYKQYIADILNSDIYGITEFIKDELQDQQTTAVISSSNCNNEVADNMSKNSEEICAHIGNIDSYVNLVMFLIPLEIYYETQESFSQIFKNYDHDLLLAQNHSRIWRNGDSIVNGIRQTFKLAKEFEPEFSRKYKINQELIVSIKQNVDQDQVINKIKSDMAKLEKQILEHKHMLNIATEPLIVSFLNKTITTFNLTVQEKKRQLTEEFTLISELMELSTFLEFVRRDTVRISAVAESTKEKIEYFRDNLEHDKSAFERHGRVASDGLEAIENRTIANNNELKALKAKQRALQRQIEEEKPKATELYYKIRDSQEKLLEMRRTLLNEISRSKTLKIIGAILTPILIGIPLLIHASNEEAKYIKLLEDTQARHKEDVEIINAQITNIYKEINMLHDAMSNSTGLSEEMRNQMKSFITIGRDLDSLSSKLETLVRAINKALVGITVMKTMFDDVTNKLSHMIDVAKTAKTEAERLDARYFIYNELSSLECNWRDVYFKVMDLDQCVRHFQILY